MQEILDRLEQILTGAFGVPEEDYAPDATFEALGLDSLDVVELTLVVEEELGVRIEDEELEDVRTVQDAARRVAEKRSAAA